MTWAAVAIGGSALVSAGIGAYSASKAAGEQAKAADQATAESRRQFDLNRTDLAPYREAGTTALSTLAPATAPGAEFNRPFTMADFVKDPGYEFRRAEGQRGVERSASARGLTLSGGTLKALDRYNQDYASGEFGTAFNRYQSDLTGRFNRLSSIAGTGQTATNTGIAAGNDLSGQISQNVLGTGNARASSYVAGGNAIGEAAGNIGQYFTLKSLLAQQQGKPSYAGNYGD